MTDYQGIDTLDPATPNHRTEPNMNRLYPIDILALSKCVSTKRQNEVADSLPPGESADVDFTVRVSGTISRGKDGTRKPTCRALTLPALVLILQRSGALQHLNVEKLADLFEEATSLNKEDQAELLQDPKIVEATAVVEAKLINKLPPVQVSGRINTKALTYELVEQQIVESEEEDPEGDDERRVA